ncbi:hypothetical protein [Curtobacterium sp. MCLR17_054]|uniref:hypothetical protein n=1 Tax=Curtobacterium sp. MCLR17_054 TaxID=2175632 RepID=UPI000DA9B841|nr:hypothetical protein [Curtobacterium sp. MCLR17_054]WIE70332.1 hypothetical protein DEJ08_018345 [Curtobacterium sp. MCLR17_054]
MTLMSATPPKFITNHRMVEQTLRWDDARAAVFEYLTAVDKHAALADPQIREEHADALIDLMRRLVTHGR